MSEFGHFYSSGGGACIDSWGAGPFEILVDGKLWRFEDSARFGPSTVSKGGDILETQPGGGSPFWRGWTCWANQGRRMADDGKTCIWDEPRPTKIKTAGRNALIVENGDDYWDSIEVVGEITAEDISAMKSTPTSPEG